MQRSQTRINSFPLDRQQAASRKDLHVYAELPRVYKQTQMTLARLGRKTLRYDEFVALDCVRDGTTSAITDGDVCICLIKLFYR